MSREEFLKELEYLLADLEEEEREEPLDYYRDYLEESGDLTPEEIAGRLGSPEKVAAEIKGSLWGDDRGGEFTERGYEDTRYKEKEQIPDSYGQIVETGGSEREAWREKERFREETPDSLNRAPGDFFRNPGCRQPDFGGLFCGVWDSGRNPRNFRRAVRAGVRGLRSGHRVPGRRNRDGDTGRKPYGFASLWNHDDRKRIFHVRIGSSSGSPGKVGMLHLDSGSVPVYF